MSVTEQKYTAEYYRGYEDAQLGTAPDYSQASAEQFRDYRAGYRAGLADAQEEAK
jgi:hypothetical protein